MAQNKNSDTKVYRFLSRMIIGLMISVLLGSWLDNQFHTSPLILILMVIYVIVGTLYLLVKEAG